MASRKPPGSSPPPVRFDDAEKTEANLVLPDLGLDLDEETEDTDKHPIPKGKLRLPKPDDLDDEPAKPAKPAKSLPPPPPPKIQPAAPPKSKRLKVFRVRPEKSGSGKLILGGAGIVIAVVMVAFIVAPDGKSARQIAREHAEGVRAGDLAERAPRKVYSYKDRFQLENPELIVRAPIEPPVTVQPTHPPQPATPSPQRHAQWKKQIVGPEPRANERFGFERIENTKREYDNFDTSKEQGNGIPMLMVFSKPSGMSVDVDGTLSGVTPLIRQLPKDTKRVKVRLYAVGFKEWEQTVSPNEIEQFKVGVTMQRVAE